MDPLTMSALAMGGSALLGGLSGATANRGKWSQQSRLSPQQLQQSNWAGQTGMQQIQNPYQGFAPIADNAIGQYNRKVIPSLAERFSSLGSNSLSSPALGGELRESGNDLQERLAAMQAQYGLQQQGLGQSLLGMGQQPQFENVYTAGGPSFLSGLFGGASQGLGALGMGGMNQHFSGMGSNPGFSGGQLGGNPQIMQLLNNPRVMSFLKGLM